MGAFELENDCLETKRSDEACIIAMKIYDQCRLQICLTPELLGPARAAESSLCQCEQICEGDIIVPPANATSVAISKFKLQKIHITNKTPNPFRSGYWDIEVKYVFTYVLTFSADCTPIYTIKAKNSYQTKMTLFGSIESDIVTTTDFCGIDAACISGGPYVSAEAKAVPLSATLHYTGNGCVVNCCEPSCGCNSCNPYNSCCKPSCGCNSGCGCEPSCGCNSGCGCEPSCGCNSSCGCESSCGCNSNCGCEPSCGCNSGCGCGPISIGCNTVNSNCPATSVSVTIGLFAITKLFRFTNLKVPCCGVCIPEECKGSNCQTENPCDYFNNLSFPLNLFTAPDCHEIPNCKKDHGKSKKPNCCC